MQFSDKEVFVKAATQNIVGDMGVPELTVTDTLAPELANDKQFALQVVTAYGGDYCYRYFSEDVRNDKDVALAFMDALGGMNLQFAPEEIRDDKDVVMVAVKRDVHALQFASSRLKNDREIVEIAIRDCPQSFRFASPELRGDAGIVALAISIINEHYQSPIEGVEKHILPFVTSEKIERRLKNAKVWSGYVYW